MLRTARPSLISALMLVGATALAGCNSGGGSAGDAPANPAGVGSGGENGGPGSGGSAMSGGATTEGPSTLALGEGVGKTGMRRLTLAELDNTFSDLVGDDTRPAKATLQEEQLGKFNNDYTKLTISSVLVEGLERLADDVTARLLADRKRRDQVVGCEPKASDAADSKCFRQFIERFGRRALRRSLTAAEVDSFQQQAEPFVARQNDFYAGVEVVLRALFQHPEFLYRAEVGTAVKGHAGLFKLDGTEIATRLSYLLWASTPSEELLDQAEGGQLQTPDDVRAAAQGMLEDPRTVATLDQFHALWLGYSVLPHPPALTASMRTESAKLIDRTFQNDASWLELFRATDTYLDKTLAQHYGLPAPAGGEGWVDYGSSGRQGLLSHGSFLSIMQDTVDTSPTRRGKRVRNELLCQDIPPPPPNVNADRPPAGDGSPCKWDRYAQHRAKASSCTACHSQMDPIGFGLENYDREGRYRSHDIDTLDGSPTFGQELPQCAIEGKGEIVGVGSFNGPAELSNLLLEQDVLGPCAATQFYRYAIGRGEEAEDQPALDEFKVRFQASGYRFRELLLGYVSSNAFEYRREEDAP